MESEIPPAPAPPGGVDMHPEEFRRHGHQLVDWIADFFADADRVPVFPDVRPGDIASMLPAEAPREGEPMADILADVDRVIMPGMAHWNHPAFFAYFTSTGSGPGVLGELLAAAFNVNSMLWHSCPSATELEEVTLSWLRRLLGLPDSFRGIMYEGGSGSTFHALAAAREHVPGLEVRERGLAGRVDVPRLLLYTSEQGHSSIDKAAVALGLGLEGVRRVGVDASYRMDVGALRAAIDEDRRAGFRPFCVVATAGSTSCTSLDPLADVADVCEGEGLWLHVDAAHGGAAAVVPELRAHFDGWERADSVVVNPHKWLFVPLDLSVLYTRRPETLRRAFSLVPEYLRTTQGDEVTNYMDYGIPLGRRFRALKLWFALRHFGSEGVARAIREHVRLARRFAERIDAHTNFERLAPVPLSTVCFRARPEGLDGAEAIDDFNERLMHSINASGEAFISHTKLDGRLALRLVVSQLKTTEGHVDAVWRLIERKARELAEARRGGVRL